MVLSRRLATIQEDVDLKCIGKDAKKLDNLCQVFFESIVFYLKV